MIDWDRLDQLYEEQRIGHDNLFPGLSDRLVPGEGSDEPIAMVIGEAPGAQEDTALRPFVGPSGKALSELMATAGLYRRHMGETPANAWVSNLVKFRPPKNRTPNPQEIRAARPFLKAEWKAIGKPKVIIPVGGTALKGIIGATPSILKWAGRCHIYHSTVLRENVFVWPMVHPRFGLSQPAARPALERDWKRLGEWLGAYQGA